MARLFLLVLVLVVLYLVLRARRARAGAGGSGGAQEAADPPAVGHPPFSPELLALSRRGANLIEAAVTGHRVAWQIDEHERWSLSQDDGLLRFHLADREVSSPAQFLGSYNPQLRSFLWSWANSSIEPAMQRDALAARSYGEEHGIPELTIGRFDDVDEGEAVQLMQAAFAAAGCTGFFRDARSAAIPYLAFGPTMTIAPHDGGPVRTVTVEVRPGRTEDSVDMSLRPDEVASEPEGH